MTTAPRLLTWAPLLGSKSAFALGDEMKGPAGPLRRRLLQTWFWRCETVLARCRTVLPRNRLILRLVGFGAFSSRMVVLLAVKGSEPLVVEAEGELEPYAGAPSAYLLSTGKLVPFRAPLSVS